MEPSKILLIGAGKMGNALLAAWLRSGIPPQSITVLEPHPSPALPGVTFVHALEEVNSAPDCIILAVKPQSMDALLSALSSSRGLTAGSHAPPLYLSIAAGKTLPYFAKHLGENAPIIRAMPNTPALIGKGITALCANDKVTKPQKQLATTLLKAAGEVVWLTDESQMDAVTALSGSGPAYVFLFLEALIEAGKSHGLHEDMCRLLAIHTIRGSAELALASKESLTTLRQNVTSPGGTTEAALSVLLKNDAFKSLVVDAVLHAIKRATELGK